MGYYEFPHTRNYDTDLGYLIKRYFELSTDFESLEKNFNDLKAWCIAQLNSEALKTLVANKLDEWLQDGTLASLVNNALLHVTTYDTVVEMLTHTGLENGSKIYCTGADSVNDGKGGHFRIRARLSTDTIDNYTLYLIDGGIKVAERIIEKFEYVTPEMFGAIGDGVTDDSNAITEASKHGLVLGSIDKQYRIKTDCNIINDTMNINFLIDDNIVIRFNGDNTIHFNDTFEVPLTEVQKHTGRGTFCTRIGGRKNITFNMCKWLRGTNFLAITQSSNINISDCFFTRAYQTAYDDGGNGYAIFIADGSSNIKVDGCSFVSIGRHCVYVSKDTEDIVSNKYISILNNIFDWSNVLNEEIAPQGLGTDSSINVRYGENIIIDNNLFYKVDGAITLIPNTDDLLNNIIISNNNINVREDLVNKCAIDESSIAEHGGKNIEISNNYIESYFGTTTVNGKITNNIFNCRRACIRVHTLYINQECTISENKLNGTEHCIVTSSSNNIIKNMIVRNNEFNANNSIGFWSYGGRITYVALCNNVFNNVATFSNSPIIADRVTYISNISTKGAALTPCFESQNVEHSLETTFTFNS